jgi:predicted O-linked N-acetylglucosamine transferase (SPINDLY family)
MRIMESMARAVELYRSGSLEEAEALCRSLLAQGDVHPSCLALLADLCLASERPAEAAAALSALTRLAPDDAANLRRLGAVLLSSGRAHDAVAALRGALNLEPDSVRAHNNLGQALLQTADVAGAIRHFECALRLDPSYAIGHCNLGMAFTATGEFDKAIAALRRAVALDPCLHLARRNLGAALARQASAWLRLERAGDALQAADEALLVHPDLAAALDLKAAALCRLHRPREALQTLEAALVRDADCVERWCDLAVVHQHLGDDDAAVRCYLRAIALDEGCALARGGLLAARMPSVPQTTLEAARARPAFERELAEFEAWLGCRQLSDADAWTLARQPFFYLSYQEQLNKPLLQRYRSAAAARLARVRGCAADAVGADNGADNGAGAWLRSSGRFKLGIVSAHVQDHSVFNALVRGWLQGLDRRRMEISLFSLGARRDDATAAAAAAVDHFDGAARAPAEWADTIAGRRLDAVIFPEIGIDRTTLALAHLRLAPRQLAAWGHPETSGLPTIDEFLSADGLEPDGAEEHYSEGLIRLPHLGVHYEPYAEDARAVGSRHGTLPPLPHDGPLLICPGAPFKYRPEDDAVWVEIARRLGRCTFAFFIYERSELSHKLHGRLAAAFAKAGLDAGRFLVFLPWLPRASFLDLLRRADVYLDTLGFSGFNTFMQAVQAHLPGVALEGRYLRGRLGSGILHHLGLAELIAATPAEYVDVAVKLAAEPAYRERVRGLLRARETQAYRDPCVGAALSAVLLR